MKPKRERFDSELAVAIGSRLKARRKSLRMSQRQLGANARITDTQICNIEKGYSVPGGSIILAIARATGMSPNEILGWEKLPECHSHGNSTTDSSTPPAGFSG